MHTGVVEDIRAIFIILLSALFPMEYKFLQYSCSGRDRLLGMSTTTPTPPLTTLWPPSGWLTKAAAAERLKLSVERVAGLVREEALHSTKGKSPESNQTVTLIHEGDVERYIFQREHPEQVVKPLNKPNKPAQLAAPAAPAAEEQSPWLTIYEASARTNGLPARVIKQLALEGELLAVDIGDDKQRIRIHREILDAYRGSKLKPDKLS